MNLFTQSFRDAGADGKFEALGAFWFTCDSANLTELWEEVEDNCHEEATHVFNLKFLSLSEVLTKAGVTSDLMVTGDCYRRIL